MKSNDWQGNLKINSDQVFIEIISRTYLHRTYRKIPPPPYLWGLPKNYISSIILFTLQRNLKVNLKELIINTKFLDQIEQPIFVKDTNGIYTYCNSAFSDFLGVPKNKVLNHTAFDIAPQAFAKIYTEADKELFASIGHQEYLSKIKPQDSSQEVKVVFKKSVIYDHKNTLSGFIGTIELHKNIVPDPLTTLRKLTEREIETLNLLASGKSVKQIASILQISPHTVTDHLKSIYLKLDVHSKNEAIYKALTFWSTHNK